MAGLSGAEAAERLRREGPNTLPQPPAVPAWRKLAAQLTHFFAIMLWIAGTLAIIGGLAALGAAIFAIIVINALFAYGQEHRSEQAAHQLRNLLPRRATAVRDGVPTPVDADDLVVGDLVLLEAGDRVPADVSVLRAHGLLVDTSTLTGESVPEAVDDGGPAWSGTFVVEGEARAVVDAVGGATRLAEIAALSQAARRPTTPMARELHRLVRIIATVAVCVGVGFFGIALLIGSPLSEGLVFAIGVTVALVPEGLLPSVTLSLAIGAQRMAAQDALVRHLESVETLGSTTFICTDKTGTLTRNQMEVVEVWSPWGTTRLAGEGYGPEAEVSPDDDDALVAARRAATVALACSNGRAVEVDGTWEPRGDPMEAAIDALARRLGPGGDPPPGPVLARFPFDPRRRMMSVVAGGRVLAKGAPDAVLTRCVDVPDEAPDALHRLSARGLRVLAVAERAHDGPVPTSPEEAEAGLVLVALLALEDPPRADVADAIAACRRAGIRVAMVTGDHAATARAIGDEVGLTVPGAPALTGDDLPPNDEVLAALLDHDGVVVARVSPEDKLRIASALQSRGHVVAMTGDGVNDGPALQKADIGVAMGASGTDVAREAADLVLLDDHFATIVSAVLQGRATFANIRRFLTYHLTDNVAELTPFLVWALSGGQVPLALSVLQVLALDLGTDTFSAVALGAEPPDPRVGTGPPAKGHFLDRTVAVRAFGVLGPTEALVEMSAFFAVFLAAGWRPGEGFPGGAVGMAASGAAFVAVVAGQSANAFACRSTTRWAGAVGWTTNRLLVWAIGLELAIAAAFLLVPPVARLLDHTPPTAIGWAVALAAALAVIVVDAVWKRLATRHT